MKYKQIIKGQVPSKSNCYKVITIHGHGSLAKQEVLKEYERNFFRQCTIRGLNITGYFKIEVYVYFRSMRSDLDNASKIILDCLQACKVIKNDNRNMEEHKWKFVDEKDPRIEFVISDDFTKSKDL